MPFDAVFPLKGSGDNAQGKVIAVPHKVVNSEQSVGKCLTHQAFNFMGWHRHTANPFQSMEQPLY
jgi:hypothetical protein